MGILTPQFGSIVPAPNQQLLASNYLSFTDGNNDFAQQYLPEIYEQEVERYGNRTLSGFLRMVGAEMPLTSDQVVWSEQNRLHIAYDNCVNDQANPSIITVPAATAPGVTRNVISPGQTIVVLDDSGNEAKCVVTASNTTTGAVTVAPYLSTDLSGLDASVKIFVYGSLFAKGTNSGSFSVEPQFTQYSNQPIIIKDRYAINGSDMAQIGWVEVATEDGTSGYLWYLKSEYETRLRFDDYLEMAMVEGELASGAGGVSFAAQAANVPGFSATINAHGSQGLFAAISARGNVFSGFAGATGISDFDSVLKNLDTQGAIEENMLFLNRDMDLEFDDMLGQISAGGLGGVAYGLFENSEDMALNLGFSGFRRGSYDFYKTSWKYLNDASTRGAVTVNNIDGVLIPAGTSTVYDQILGTNIRRPFLHVRYRASQADDRRYKNWITGTAGGAYTSEVDEMVVNWLSERCLVTQAANNFVLFQN